MMNGIKLLTFDSNFFHLLRHVQNAYFCKTQMKAIPKIVLVRKVSTVTEFKLMFVLFCFSSGLLIRDPRYLNSFLTAAAASYFDANSHVAEHV